MKLFSRRPWLALTVLVGFLVSSCGRIGYRTLSDGATPEPLDAGASADARVPSPDDGGGMPADAAADAQVPTDEDGGLPDAGILSLGCRFGTPEWVGAVASSGREQGPTLSANLRVLCFASDRPGGVGGLDILCVERPSLSAPWGVVTAYPIVSSADVDRDPALTPDGWEMFYASNRPGGAGGLDLYHAVFDRRSYTFQAPTRVAALSTAADDYGPEVASDGLTMYFSRRPTGGGPSRLYVTRRRGIALDFDPPTEIAELASAHHDNEPSISADGQNLVWCSDRPAPGRPSLSYNVWCAERDGAVWGPAVFVDAVALGAADPCSPELGSDGALFFTSSTLPGASGVDVFRAPPL